jgi:hypothetical protein
MRELMSEFGVLFYIKSQCDTLNLNVWRQILVPKNYREIRRKPASWNCFHNTKTEQFHRIILFF